MMALPERKYIRVKLLSAGDTGVGKSCLIKRYCEQKFISRYISTIGVDFGVRPVVLDLPPTRSGGNSTNDSLEVRVNFWDLSGDPDFADVRTEFYEHTQAMLLVYDVTARASFENLEKWLREAEKHGARPLITVVAANKADDDAAGPQRQVSEEEGRRWAAAHSIGYYETSAKSGHDVNLMFSELLQRTVAKLSE